MNDITKFNDKYLKCIVTKYKSTMGNNALGNSGSLIIYQPASGELINRNYIYLGNEFLASGYGFSDEDTQYKAEAIVKDYDRQIKELKDTDVDLNQKINIKFNELKELLELYVKTNGGNITNTVMNINGKVIKTKDIILYGEEAQYKNLEILDISIKINDIETNDSVIFLPVGSYIYNIKVNIHYKINDSGGIKKLQVKHKLENDQTVIIDYNDTDDGYYLDNELQTGYISYEKILENPLLVDRYLENIISKFYIHVKATPISAYKNYPGIEEMCGISIPSSGNAIRDNIISVIKNIDVRPQFYLHYGYTCNTIDFGDGYIGAKPLNSFKDYDETKVILDNLFITENTQYIYIAVPSLFKVQKVYVIKDNIEKYNWTGAIEIRNNANLQAYYQLNANLKKYLLNYSIYRIYSVESFLPNIKIELDIIYNQVKFNLDTDYYRQGSINLTPINDDTEVLFNFENDNNELINDEEFNNIYWINGGRPNSEESINKLYNRLNTISINGVKK